MRPDCFIAGFYKCGTSTMYDILKQHKDIVVSTEKENDFFMKQQLYKKGIEWYEKTYYANLERKPGQIVMEINPHLAGKSGTAARIRKYYPADTKVMFIMRNPVKMYYSHFKFSMQLGKYPLGETVYCAQNGFSKAFDRYLKKYPNNYKHFENMYSRQITEYINCFGKENVHCVFLEDMISDQRKFFEEVFEFFGLEYDENINYNVQACASEAMPIHAIWLKVYAAFKNFRESFPLKWRDIFIFRVLHKLLYRVYDKCSDENVQMSKNAERRLKKYFYKEKCRIENLVGYKLDEKWW